MVPRSRSASQARSEAPAAETRSFRDTWTVPVDPATGEVGAQVVRQPPSSPPESDVDGCTSRPGAESGPGRVHSRFLWCQRWHAEAQLFLGPVVVGYGRLDFTAVAYGRDDGDRSVRVALRSDGADWDGWFFTSSSVMGMWADCAPQTDPWCSSAGATVGKTLGDWVDDRSWHEWNIASNESGSTSPDKVLRHKWQFNAYARDSDGRDYEQLASPSHTIRCDSANYFSSFGDDLPKACIFDDVIPHLRYSTKDPRVSQVARHIRDAQDRPDMTYPITGGKVIPGKYTGDRDDPGLHRIPGDSSTHAANRDHARWACNSQGPYAGIGLPAPPGPGQQCDEYPFASTEEGGASRDWDFSVRAVDGRQNASAGGLLNWFYTSDRILYGTDEFYVEITDEELTPGG
jgi:Deoxyribonuclease NucA/NucB